MRRLVLFLFLGSFICGFGGSAAAGPTPTPIPISGYTVTPPFLTDGGGLALTTWRLRLTSPYTGGGSYDFASIALRHYGCEVKHPKVILSGQIAVQPDVSYEVQYDPSGGDAVWKTLTPIVPASDGSFFANYLDPLFGRRCPTKNINFRVFGTDSAGNQYASAEKTVKVFPSIRVGGGPRQPPNYHVGTVWFRKIHIKDPSVKQIQVRVASKLDPNHQWRLNESTKFHFVKNIRVRNGVAVFKFRIPNHKTFVFRFTTPGTPTHAKNWNYQWVWIGI